MTNVFVYTMPHPAHKALADSINCVGVKTNRKGIAKLPFLGRYIAAKRVQKEVESYKPDIILTESVSTDLLAGALYKSKHKSVKLVGLVTDPKIYEFSNAPMFDQLLTIYSLDKSDLLFVVSKMMYDMMPVYEKCITKLFYPGILNLDTHLNKVAKHGKNLVFVGRLDEYKGTDLLPRVFDEIRFKHPDAKLYVAGDGKNRDLFEDKNDQNIFYLNQTKNSLFMSNVASFYISLARFEPSGCAVIEAMAQGLVPLVSTGVGYKEIVKQINPELVFNTEEELYEVYNKLVKNKKLYYKYSKKAKQIAKKLSYANSVKQFKRELSRNKII
jgi:glycosyltransferase involved in cell wall biosynthesis